MDGNKYVVFKVEDFEAIAADKGTATRNEFMRKAIPDAVVLRRQDLTVPQTLYAYSSSLALVAKALAMDGNRSVAERYQRTADWFHEQAELASEEAYKLPD